MKLKIYQLMIYGKLEMKYTQKKVIFLIQIVENNTLSLLVPSILE